MESFSTMSVWENRFPGFSFVLFNQHSGKLETGFVYWMIFIFDKILLNEIIILRKIYMLCL